MKPKVVVIVGPTASGKTKLSIELAKKINGEIISSDSMQIYKDMNIGTAKVTEEEKEGIEHYLVDFVDPDERYTVSDFKRDAEKAIKEASLPHDAVSRVSRNRFQKYDSTEHLYHVVAIDCGMKMNIVRSLTQRGCDVMVVPWNARVRDILSLDPDGVFLSNGPGDPEDVPEVIDAVKELIGTVPIFGICLGHQILSLAYGAKTYKLKFGHRGGNHPVKNLLTNQIEITSQNHSYAVDAESLKKTPLTATHINLLDNTVEGVECAKNAVFGVQYHPESAPGPQDSSYLFDRFIDWMKEAKDNA